MLQLDWRCLPLGKLLPPFGPLLPTIGWGSSSVRIALVLPRKVDLDGVMLPHNPHLTGSFLLFLRAFVPLLLLLCSAERVRFEGLSASTAASSTNVDSPKIPLASGIAMAVSLLLLRMVVHTQARVRITSLGTFFSLRCRGKHERWLALRESANPGRGPTEKDKSQTDPKFLGSMPERTTRAHDDWLLNIYAYPTMSTKNSFISNQRVRADVKVTLSRADRASCSRLLSEILGLFVLAITDSYIILSAIRYCVSFLLFYRFSLV